jgi:hypothetical protein
VRRVAELGSFGQMKKSRHPRSKNDFTIHSLAWDRDIVANYSRAGFTVPADVLICDRFWRYLDFLQSHGLTSRIVAGKKEDVVSGTALRNFDLTDTGFRFIQSIEQKWCGRLMKGDEPTKVTQFLEKWFMKFQKEAEPCDGANRLPAR